MRRLEYPIAGKDYTLDLPTGYLSYSQITKYMHCPRLYWFEYCAKIERRQNVYQAEGSVMHEVIEASFIKWLKIKKHLTFKQAKAKAKKVWQELLPIIEDWGYCETPERVESRIAEFLHLLFEQGQISQWEPSGVEQKYEIKLAGVPVVGYTDLIETNCVTDFKTTGSPSSYKAESSLQLMLHCLAWDVTQARFAFLVKSSSKNRYARIDNPSPVVIDLEAAREWVEGVVGTVAKSISEGHFFPRSPDVNPYCSESCSAWTKCFGEKPRSYGQA